MKCRTGFRNFFSVEKCFYQRNIMYIRKVILLPMRCATFIKKFGEEAVLHVNRKKEKIILKVDKETDLLVTDFLHLNLEIAILRQIEEKNRLRGLLSFLSTLRIIFH